MRRVIAAGLIVVVVGVGTGCAAHRPEVASNVEGGASREVPGPSRTAGPARPVPPAMPSAARLGGLSPASGAGHSRTGPPAGSPSATSSAPAPDRAPAHFGTLPPGSSLPSGARCAAWVRATPYAENKRMNAAANQVTGQRLGSDFFPANDDPRANTQLRVRVDGAFTGTTRQILRWAACKWGIDEDVVYAQAAVESWWRQTTKGDYYNDPTECPPGHPLGADGQPGNCPQSWGILQNRYPNERSAWPAAERSTAMNADTAYAIWRVCYQGYESWLNTVERGRQYGAGDMWGCVGRWFSGRWHTAAAEGYIAKVQGARNDRVWETPDFQEG